MTKQPIRKMERGGRYLGDRDLRAVRNDLEEVKRDLAVVVANGTAAAETMNELRACLKGEDGVAKKVTILWDRQERATRHLLLIGGAAITALAASMAKITTSFFSGVG
jgi:hypothetical protein